MGFNLCTWLRQNLWLLIFKTFENFLLTSFLFLFFELGLPLLSILQCLCNKNSFSNYFYVSFPMEFFSHFFLHIFAIYFIYSWLFYRLKIINLKKNRKTSDIPFERVSHSIENFHFSNKNKMTFNTVSTSLVGMVLNSILIINLELIILY